VVKLFFEHLIQIATGIGAAAACLLFLHLLGLLLIPQRHSSHYLNTPRAAFVGAAVTILWCSYGLRLEVPLPKLLFAEICVMLILLVLRRAFLFDLLANATTIRRLLEAFGLFALFFTLSYCFLMPPASSEYLPIVTRGNNDIFNYINCTRFLQFLGQSNLANYLFRVPFGGTDVGVYDQVPAVYYILFGISAFFGSEPMRAAMPTIFCAVALVGCAVTWLTKIAFDLPKPVCIAVAALVVSGPFFRYNVGQYFLAQIFGTAVVLLMLGETARILTTRLPIRLPVVFSCFLPFHIVLCFTYPIFSVLGSAWQLGFFLIYRLLSTSKLDTESIADLVKTSILWTGGILSGVMVAWLADPWHGFLNLRNLAMISQVGAIGWIQDFISPLATIGLPVPTQISGRNSRIFVVVGYVAFVLFVGSMLTRLRPRAATTAQTFYLLAALSSLIYFTYYFLVGPSYQQWKLAAYLPLTLSFAIMAAALKIVLPASARPAARTRARQLSVALIICTACVSLILANMVIHYVKETPPQQFSANYANLKTLETLTGVQSIFINMDSFSATFFPVYFIRNKLLHLISPSYYSQEALNPGDVSPQTPLFFEGRSCEPDQYHSPVPGVGCLFFQDPTLRPNHSYQFNQRSPEIAEPPGLGGREPWGRWSNSKTVIITLYANDEDLYKLPNGFINIDLSPFLPGGMKAQSVSLRWGKDRNGHLTLYERSWISLPISEQDWASGDVRKLSIEFDLPDAISPKEVDATTTDTRALAIGFIAISWTPQLMGRVPAV
jgi:hypothetical protein